MKRIPLMLLGCLLAGRVTLQAASVGTEGAAFLNIPVGAGPAALGSAYTALAANAYAPVYNPAGLGFLSANEIAAQHLSYLESMHYEHFSIVHPFSSRSATSTKKGIGFSLQYLGSGDIAGTNDTGAPTGDFSSYYAAYNLAYGQQLSDKLAVGLTGKMINAKIDDVSASAFAADFGGLYRMNPKLTFAGSLVNVGSKLKFIDQGDSLPLAFHVAAAYRPKKQWLMTGEGVYRKTGLASAHFGGEWRPLEAVAVRAGYKTDTLDGLSAVAGVTAGLGLYVWGQELAYAFSPYGDLGTAQYISLLVRFGADTEAKRNLIQYRSINKHQLVKDNKSHKDEMEPEYQQLMQLLSDSDAHFAQNSLGAEK